MPADPSLNKPDASSERQPVLFVPHGGGPCFFMNGAEQWDHMAQYLRGIEASLPRRPDAILVISGHWETALPSVTTALAPPLLYDYYGFPPHTYELRYPVPGSPELAQKVRSLLESAGIQTAGDANRGLDHGVFIPFLMAFGKAEIPVVELSLQEDLDPALHLQIGRALSALRDENILIVATGMTYHNLRSFRSESPQAGQASIRFDEWLAETVTSAPAQRDANLTRWDRAPNARDCHPQEEHLIPLMVAAGAAGNDIGVRDYSDTIMGKALSGFRFG